MSRRAPSLLPVLHRGDLPVDHARHRASRGCRPLSLTREEYGILKMLLAAGGALASAEEPLGHVRDAHAHPFGNIVSVTMTRLRRKLGDPPCCAASSWTPGFPASAQARTSHRKTARTRRPATLPPPLTHMIGELG